ncbi:MULTISPECIES: ABC transporter permease [Prauserella salsuginis group]|uniref:Peptide/nickel transport system permease protein n=2 Tax=Prauserella salsuginis group TaxID=2893672 RepID=A0A839XMX6_9PSEU|nr:MULTISPECIES: ABC transporter permease [Prauserella salsuginis group]MBB3663219.1 peptide/nickel transport system permease protein [Prauserella sediminis]MCR3720954.1 peptide/nickel transport system permease protein [Prauserella flava]MCR3734965.1 peptide/nickel transport system permease protein [Prauserella salsuginis]
MLRFTVRRLLQAVPTLFVLSILVFAWLRMLPGGPATALLGDKATPERVAAMNAVLGLDDPIFVQYFRFLGRVLTGDFGSSLITGDPVMEEVSWAFPATLELSAAAMFLAVLFGIPMGYIAARFRGRFLDNATVVTTLVGVAVPVFFLGFLLKYIFTQEMSLLPPSGRQDVLIDATRITGIATLDGLLTGEFDATWDAMLHLILPSVALASIPFAVIVRITRASVLDVQGEDFVRTANSKGLTTQIVRKRHVLRNALLPVSTTIGLQTGLLMSGAVLTEKVFAWGGLGTLLEQAIQQRDYPRLQGLILLFATVFVLVNLLVDISYAIIDPRVRVR